LLIIDHGDGYMTLYGHNQELLKDTGDWVKTNEIIARAGNTGGLSAPALYFEIRSQGQPTSPKKWLQKS
jgi:septal ring factor EnvC (AmiA/AmiB activator)